MTNRDYLDECTYTDDDFSDVDNSDVDVDLLISCYEIKF